MVDSLEPLPGALAVLSSLRFGKDNKVSEERETEKRE